MAKIAQTSTVTSPLLGSRLVWQTVSALHVSDLPVANFVACGAEETAFVPNEYEPTGWAWATQKMYDDGMRWTFKIPKCIKNGPYLIRHETMAVQDARELGKAQFYPNCAQVWVNGGTGKLSPKKVKLPGDIKPTDPSVYFPRQTPPFNYTCP